MGDKSHGQALGQTLLSHSSPSVRANAAMLLGMLGDSGAIAVLNQARFDKDENVVDMVVESKARLGDSEAVEQLIFAANSDMGPQEVTAINTLRDLKNPRFKGLFEHKLKNATFLETKLAAARALGQLGSDDGYNVAIKALRNPKGGRLGKGETKEIQRSRITGMAVHALGAIGNDRALGTLESTMEKKGDVSVQLAAAKAILEIVNKPGSGIGSMYNTAYTAN
jgi:HEAT repeat protein